ncbi:MAG: hypothetical protein ACM3MF_07550 [Anaerolineae bacterium]
MKRTLKLLVLSFVSVALLACGLFSKPEGNNGVGGTGGTGGTGGNGGSGGNYSTKFPMPDSVINFTEMGNGAINFQTKMSIKDTLQFYRAAFEKQGLKERETNTAITATTFSLVFDGDTSGQAVVLQGVDLGNGMTNVNIRYEKT